MSGGADLTSYWDPWSFSSTTSYSYPRITVWLVNFKKLKWGCCCGPEVQHIQKHMKMGNDLRNEVARTLCTEGSDTSMTNMWGVLQEEGFYWTVKYAGHCCFCRHDKTSSFLQLQDETVLTQGRQDDEASECTSPFLAGGWVNLTFGIYKTRRLLVRSNRVFCFWSSSAVRFQFARDVPGCLYRISLKVFGISALVEKKNPKELRPGQDRIKSGWILRKNELKHSLEELKHKRHLFFPLGSRGTNGITVVTLSSKRK